MIAEKFPPFNQSGSARPFYFAKYLPDFGYTPAVLASSLLAGDERDDSLLAELPVSVQVQRTPRLISPRVMQLRQRWRARRPAQEAAARQPLPEKVAPRQRGWVKETYGWLGWWS